MACYAKIQLGTTLELATVPDLPLIPNIYQKFVALRESGVDGFLGGWNFGNFLTVSTFAVSKLCDEAFPASEEAFLRDLAIDYFGNCDSEKVGAAWRRFCDAFACYPFSIPFLYQGPISYAPVFQWRDEYVAKPMEAWVSCYFQGVRPEGDRLDDCLGPFSLQEVVALLRRMVPIWKEGVDLLGEGLQEGNVHSREELSTAGMIYHHLRSAYNIFRYHDCTRHCARDGEERHGMSVKAVVDDEIDNLSGAIELVKRDSRLGFYAETQSYVYDAGSVADSIDRLRLLREKL